MSQHPDPTPSASSGPTPATTGGDPTLPVSGSYPPPPPGAVPSTTPMPPPAQRPQDYAASPPWAPSQPAPSGSSSPRVGDEDRTMGVLAHVSPIIAAILSVGWLTIVGPLVIWVFYKDRSPLVRQAAAGAFNFTLLVWAAIIAGWVCLFTVILIPLALLLWLAAGVVGLVCHIQGAVKASRGEPYTYPLSIPVLS